FIRYDGEPLFHHALHTARVFLRLPPGEAATVVFEAESNSRHQEGFARKKTDSEPWRPTHTTALSHADQHHRRIGAHVSAPSRTPPPYQRLSGRGTSSRHVEKHGRFSASATRTYEQRRTRQRSAGGYAVPGGGTPFPAG